ncbi:hypothetical protein LIER_42730 [Lithospermum erythrorhizon]|uniref:Uncharacterized protein n=1 Tax=Lithospermum erythrorhizon TaxID=34254 RepID=A0AAV3NT37_LITER
MVTSVPSLELDVTHTIGQAFDRPDFAYGLDSNRPRSSIPTGPLKDSKGLSTRYVWLDEWPSLHRHSTMSQTSDEFVGSLLRDSPDTTNVGNVPRVDSANVDDSQGPLNVMPLPISNAPSNNVPVVQGSKVAPLEASKGKWSKDPPTSEQVKAKTIPGLITESTNAF